jgi:hypothetical protein
VTCLRISILTSLAIAVSIASPRPALFAQAASPTSTSTSAGAAPAMPTITLLQPGVAGTVPQDRPVVAFRFAGADPSDPLDYQSFAASVDGRDRTKAFQVAAGEAWGTLAGALPHERTVKAPLAALESGAHQVTARICTVRGSCAEFSATVSVSAATPAALAAQDLPRRPGPIALLSSICRWLLGR